MRSLRPEQPGEFAYRLVAVKVIHVKRPRILQANVKKPLCCILVGIAIAHRLRRLPLQDRARRADRRLRSAAPGEKCSDTNAHRGATDVCKRFHAALPAEDDTAVVDSGLPALPSLSVSSLRLDVGRAAAPTAAGLSEPIRANAATTAASAVVTAAATAAATSGAETSALSACPAGSAGPEGTVNSVSSWLSRVAAIARVPAAPAAFSLQAPQSAAAFHAAEATVTAYRATAVTTVAALKG